MTASVEQARAAFAQRDWAEAFARFTVAAERESLDAADLERLAVSAYLIGKDDDSAKAWAAAQRAAAATGDVAEAARYAFWLAFILMLRGQMAHAAGWLTRSDRLIQQLGEDCPASGYVLVPRFLGALEEGDPSGACDLAARAAEVGDRFGDADLRALGTLGHGQSLIAMGDVAGGLAQLDAVMVAVAGDEVGPIAAGIVYCAVILECMKLFDLRRAAEWTDALGAWCDAQPDLVPYRGQCLVHRSQLQQAAGDWPDAISTAEAACRRLNDPPHPALGLANYQEGELHRLIGAFEQADHDYRLASRHGYDPVPGFALLQLARGDGTAAAAGIQRAFARGARPVRPTGTSGRRSRHSLLHRRRVGGPHGRRRTAGAGRHGVIGGARRDGRARDRESSPERGRSRRGAAAAAGRSDGMAVVAHAVRIGAGGDPRRTGLLSARRLHDCGSGVRQRASDLPRARRGTRPRARAPRCPPS